MALKKTKTFNRFKKLSLENLDHLQTSVKLTKSLENVYILLVNFDVCKFAHLQRFYKPYKISVNFTTFCALRSHEMSVKSLLFPCKFCPKSTDIL